MTLSCSVTSGTGTGDDGYRVLAINDAAHGGDGERFYFLPPLVPNPGVSGVFDGSVSPVVEIVTLSSDGTYDPDDPTAHIAVFTMGEGSGYIKMGLEDEHYAVNWHTKNYELYIDLTYRIRILLDTEELGFADVVVVNSGQDIKTADSDETKALKNGRTIPIKFRIEEAATDQNNIW